MHGNTVTTPGGVKTRDFNKILDELTQAFEVHYRMGTCLGGVHFELTGENVTECVGGAAGLNEADLSRAYHSDIDPRLNYEQALEMALQIAHQMRLRNGYTHSSRDSLPFQCGTPEDGRATAVPSRGSCSSVSWLRRVAG